MTDWHGWARNRPGAPALHVGPLPGRKSIAVYTVEGGVIDVVAYCRDEEAARRLVEALDGLILS